MPKNKQTQESILSGLYEDCIARAELEFFNDSLVLARILDDWVHELYGKDRNAQTENIFNVYTKYNDELLKIIHDKIPSSKKTNFECFELEKKFKKLMP